MLDIFFRYRGSNGHRSGGLGAVYCDSQHRLLFLEHLLLPLLLCLHLLLTAPTALLLRQQVNVV